MEQFDAIVCPKSKTISSVHFDDVAPASRIMTRLPWARQMGSGAILQYTVTTLEPAESKTRNLSVERCPKLSHCSALRLDGWLRCRLESRSDPVTAHEDPISSRSRAPSPPRRRVSAKSFSVPLSNISLFCKPCSWQSLVAGAGL